MIDKILIWYTSFEEAIFDGPALLSLESDGGPIHQENLLFSHTNILLDTQDLLQEGK